MKAKLISIILNSMFCINLTSCNNVKQLSGAEFVIEAEQYASLHDAINAIPQTGGILQIPPGVFEISEPLVIDKDDVTIRGAGTATQIKNINENGRPALVIQHPAIMDGRQYELWRVNLFDIRIIGNDKSGHGIEAMRVNELFISGVTVSFHGGDGIHLYYCYEDPRISNSLITYNKKAGVHILESHDIIVSDNQFEENYDGVYCIKSPNLCMNGNNMDDHIGSAIVLEGTRLSVISGNMIEESIGFGMVIDKASHANTISSNIFVNNQAGGLDLRNAHGSTVSANTFISNPVNALRIDSQSRGITVTGNNFTNNHIGDGKLYSEGLPASGIVLEGTSDICIVGNLFTGILPGALKMEGKKSERINFSANVLTNVNINDEGLLTNSLINNNLR